MSLTFSPRFLTLWSIAEQMNGNMDLKHFIKDKEKKFAELFMVIVELAEHSPIIMQNSSNPSSRKNLDVQSYDRPYKVLLLTCMVNWTAGTVTTRLCSVVQWSVHWAPSQVTWVLVLAGARCYALETCRKKNTSSAFRLG